MTKKDELIDELLKGVKSPEDLFGKDGLLKQLSKSPVKRHHSYPESQTKSWKR